MYRTNRPAVSGLLAAALGCSLFFWQCSEFDTFADYGGPHASITIHAGNAVAHNIAVQTINPWPDNVGNAQINIDGQRLMNGLARYKANASLPPQGLSTQAIINGD